MLENEAQSREEPHLFRYRSETDESEDGIVAEEQLYHSSVQDLLWDWKNVVATRPSTVRRLDVRQESHVTNDVMGTSTMTG
ncbi:hypothetical protein LSTR_LSTR006476 [Laodelphax striatellus]|uniref:Uncharacterized protein n=1 Tax=Laodelphax striatellus TaxID=195883 RepID=A0A482WWW0_LAOST|nr:hypothetical protein LSTR_LSTR006476 [Laodelphax striatellus]